MDIGKMMRNLSMLPRICTNARQKRVRDPPVLLEFCLTVRIWVPVPAATGIAVIASAVKQSGAVAYMGGCPIALI
jgi:hypothetical protein